MDFVNYVVNSYQSSALDERTKDYLIVRHQWVLYVVFVLYLLIVLRIGPKYMENRRPYSLKTFIKYYNIFQIIYNGWIVYAGFKYGAASEIGLTCAKVDKSTEGNSMNLVHLMFWTLVLKIIDLIETGVFVLRKKQRQISFLHVYHHISTIYLAHTSVKFYPGGMATIPTMVNSTVHVIMYSYYFLSSQGPKVQKFINPFKPYITIMQMTQFFFLLGHTVQAFEPSCETPKWGVVLMFFNLLINFVLFYNFYRQNYKNKPKAKSS